MTNRIIMSNLPSNDPILLLESMTQSVLITTPELSSPGPYITYVNKAFEEMTGWRREEIIGKNPRFLQGPKTNFKIFINLRSLINKGEVWKGQTINYKKDGTEFYMEWSITPVYNKVGKLEQLLAVQNDVTENVKIKRQLEKARKGELERVQEIQKANIKLNSLAQEQQKTLDLFKKYVPESVVKKTLSNTKKDIKKGVALDVSLLFCDIRNFTSMVENMNPTEVVRLLDTYYSKMAEVVKMYNGVITQFTGDEIFVTFGAPNSIKNPEVSSAHCAIEMIKKLVEINRDLADILPQGITVGIGLNHGSIIAGNLGSEERLTYAITGDAVNIAKRIESLTTGLSDTILISETIYKKIKELFSTKPWGEVSVKGKEKKIRVHQLI